MTEKYHYELYHKNIEWGFVNSFPDEKTAIRELNKIIKSWKIKKVKGGYME